MKALFSATLAATLRAEFSKTPIARTSSSSSAGSSCGSKGTTFTRRVLTLPGALVLAVATALVPACSNDDPETLRIDFSQGTQGWVGGFADYPVGEDALFELVADYRPLRAPLNTSQNAQFISGNNHSDDLWMYYKGRLAGLDANRRYRVRFEVEIATSVPHGCIGVGGAPGEGVTVKAGVSTTEPGAVVVGGDWKMNVNKGQQTNGGRDALAIGDVANGVACGETPKWELKQLSSGSELLEVETDSSGSVWLFVGTDSGFEATTSVYYTWVVGTFEPL